MPKLRPTSREIAAVFSGEFSGPAATLHLVKGSSLNSYCRQEAVRFRGGAADIEPAPMAPVDQNRPFVLCSTRQISQSTSIPLVGILLLHILDVSRTDRSVEGELISPHWVVRLEC
jgi:hypothetical protein